jgi:hypothetical protein
MAKTATSQKTSDISDAAAQAKTGKTWEQWFALLDRAGAGKMTHQEIAVYLHDQAGCPNWWSQMVTVGYERARGRREKNQTPGGFTVGVSRTIAVPIEQLFNAWNDPAARGHWLPRAKLTIRTAIANKSMRITWGKGPTGLEVLFYKKDVGKSQVTLTHLKLEDADEVERKRAYWKKALDRLQLYLQAE